MSPTELREDGRLLTDMRAAQTVTANSLRGSEQADFLQTIPLKEQDGVPTCLLDHNFEIS